MRDGKENLFELVISNKVLAHVQVLQRLVSSNRFCKTCHIACAKSIVLQCQFLEALVLNEQIDD